MLAGRMTEPFVEQAAEVRGVLKPTGFGHGADGHGRVSKMDTGKPSCKTLGVVSFR